MRDEEKPAISLLGKVAQRAFAEAKAAFHRAIDAPDCATKRKHYAIGRRWLVVGGTVYARDLPRPDERGLSPIAELQVAAHVTENTAYASLMQMACSPKV